MIDDMTISDQLRLAVAECGVSQYELARRIGVSRSMMSHFMSGRSNMSIAVMNRLAPIIDLRLTSPGLVAARRRESRAKKAGG